jgi:hypothetical protein
MLVVIDPGAVTTVGILQSGCQAVDIFLAPAGSTAFTGRTVLQIAVFAKPSTRTVSRLLVS